MNKDISLACGFEAPDYDSGHVRCQWTRRVIYGHPSPVLLFTLPRMSGCPSSSDFWNLDSACTRSFWGAFIPAAFVFVLCVAAAIPIPTKLSNILCPIKALFDPFLTLQEAEALDVADAAESKAVLGEVVQGEPEAVIEQVEPRQLWKPLLLSWIALVETLAWLGVASFNAIQDQRDPVDVVSSFAFALIWLFATLRPILRPKPTPSFDLLVLYLICFIVEVVSLGTFIYNKNAYGTPFPDTLTLAAHILNLVALFVLITLVFSMPLAIPSRRVDKDKIVSWSAGSLLRVHCSFWNDVGKVRLPRGLHDSLGLDHVFMDLATHPARTCSRVHPFA